MIFFLFTFSENATRIHHRKTLDGRGAILLDDLHCKGSKKRYASHFLARHTESYSVNFFFVFTFSENATRIHHRKTPDGRGAILLDDLHCKGNEWVLGQCPLSGNGRVGQNNCRHQDDIGVECK